MRKPYLSLYGDTAEGIFAELLGEINVPADKAINKAITEYCIENGKDADTVNYTDGVINGIVGVEKTNMLFGYLQRNYPAVLPKPHIAVTREEALLLYDYAVMEDGTPYYPVCIGRAAEACSRAAIETADEDQLYALSTAVNSYIACKKSEYTDWSLNGILCTTFGSGFETEYSPYCESYSKLIGLVNALGKLDVLNAGEV